MFDLLQRAGQVAEDNADEYLATVCLIVAVADNRKLESFWKEVENLAREILLD